MIEFRGMGVATRVLLFPLATEDCQARVLVSALKGAFRVSMWQTWLDQLQKDHKDGTSFEEASGMV